MDDERSSICSNIFSAIQDNMKNLYAPEIFSKSSFEELGAFYYGALNDLWLRIIGLNETIEVPKTARYARERMSWTNIANVFFVDENEIDKSASLVIKDSRYETPLIASLYFLLTADYKRVYRKSQSRRWPRQRKRP